MEGPITNTKALVFFKTWKNDKSSDPGGYTNEFFFILFGTILDLL